MAIEVVPGAVHIPGWLDTDQQRALVAACREWSRPPAGMRTVRVRGGVMSAQTACLGWYWYPYRYSRTADDADGAPVKAFPAELGDLGRRAVAEAADTALHWPNYTPDVGLINYYGPTARMGLHQDRDERSLAPVVSISLGDTGIFRLGNTVNRNRPWTDVELRSGDLFIFGGPSRLAYHGVTKILSGTGPQIGIGARNQDLTGKESDTKLIPLNHDMFGGLGRLNITLRESGLE